MMDNVEKVISVLLDEKNWESLTGIDGVPSFAMDAVVLLYHKYLDAIPDDPD